MRVLVTGADGFIGSHLVEALVRGGHEVVAFCWYNARGSLGWLDRCAAGVRGEFEFYLGDVRDVSIQFAMDGCTHVAHLAALIGIPYSYVAPDAYLQTNVMGTLNVLQSARDEGVQGFVFSSTSEVYGTAQTVPISEAHPLNAQSPYAASKVAAESLALSFYHSFNLPVTVVRPFNTYGPRQSARAVIPQIILQIARGERVLQLGNLAPTRDFSYVDDTVRGFMAALQMPAAVGKVVNLGSRFEVSIRDTVKIIATLMGADVQIRQEGGRVRPNGSEVDRLLCENAMAKYLLGWSPQFGGEEGFKAGLSRTIDWFTDPANLALYREGYQV